MKHSYLMIGLLMVAAIFSSCNSEEPQNLPNPEDDLEQYDGVENFIELQNSSRLGNLSAMLYCDSEPAPNVFIHDLTIMANITYEELDDMYEIPNEFLYLEFGFYAKEKLVIPSGTYPILYEMPSVDPSDDDSFLGDLMYMPPNITGESNRYYALEMYEIAEGTIKVINLGDEYIFDVNCVLDNGRVAKAFYRGKLDAESPF